MNRPQRIVLLVFIFASLFTGLFPPWYFQAEGIRKRAGFRFLLTPAQLPLTRTDTQWVPDESKPKPNPADLPPCKKSRVVCEFERWSDVTPEKAITKTVEIGTLEGRIDFTQLLVEWVTLSLVGFGLLLLFKTPNGSVSLATRETPAP